MLILHVGREQTRQLLLLEGHRPLLCWRRGTLGFRGRPCSVRALPSAACRLRRRQGAPQKRRSPATGDVLHGVAVAEAIQLRWLQSVQRRLRGCPEEMGYSL